MAAAIDRKRGRPTGVDGSAVALYLELRKRGAVTDIRELADELEIDQPQAEADWHRLHALGLTTRGTDGSGVVAVGPDAALASALTEQQRVLTEALAQTDTAHRKVEILTETFLPLAVAEQTDVEVELLTDGRRITQVLDDIIQLVQFETASMHPGPLPPINLLMEGLARDRRHVEHGGRVRVIYPQRFAAVPQLSDYFKALSDLGAEVRLATVVPMHMVIGDGRIALLPVDPEDISAGAVVARGAALVRSYAALYEYCWHTSSIFDSTADTEESRGEGPTEQQLALVRMLASGMKDERIARQLGISRRTLSRTLSDVMELVGADSRFQVGVSAARLGWLD